MRYTWRTIGYIGLVVLIGLDIFLKSAILNFEAVCATSAASFLEFPALRADVGFDVAMGFDGGGCRPVTKVFVDFARFFRATQEDCAAPLGFTQRKLVKREALATSLQDATPRRLCESQGTHGHLRHY